ncbi:MAG: hypothetical protein KGI04_02195 [Candidatus Micrarchaeota archaeon]|nr:hypothetical protein [Candidatus Micrarchaeota archaeon]
MKLKQENIWSNPIIILAILVVGVAFIFKGLGAGPQNSLPYVIAGLAVIIVAILFAVMTFPAYRKMGSDAKNATAGRFFGIPSLVLPYKGGAKRTVLYVFSAVGVVMMAAGIVLFLILGFSYALSPIVLGFGILFFVINLILSRTWKQKR